MLIYRYMDFSGGSDGKESACSAGDPSSIPGSGRSPREGTGYPLQYPWAPLVAQMVKNLPAVQETWVWSLEERKATHSSIVAWRIPMDRAAWWAEVHMVAQSLTPLKWLGSSVYMLFLISQFITLCPSHPLSTCPLLCVSIPALQISLSLSLFF